MYPNWDTIPQLFHAPDVLLQLLKEKSKHITKHLNVWSLGKLVSFVFPQLLMFKSTSSWETLGLSGKQNCFSRDHTLSIYNNCNYFLLFGSKGLPIPSGNDGLSAAIIVSNKYGGLNINTDECVTNLKMALFNARWQCGM